MKDTDKNRESMTKGLRGKMSVGGAADQWEVVCLEEMEQDCVGP